MTMHVNTATERTPGEAEIRTWDDLRDSGMLWLINRQVFHPRGFALALVQVDGQIIGWRLLGHGQEPCAFAGSEDEWFAAAQATLAASPTSAP